MLTDLMNHLGLVKEFRQTGFYETPQHKQLFKELKATTQSGSLIALTGVVGCGKTSTLRRLFDILTKENKVLVSKSLAVDKNRTTLKSLISALFYDLSPDAKNIKVPSIGEKRERELQTLIKKGKKPVVLFVDEAHDLHFNTLKGLKRLMEVVEDGQGKLSIILAGHPKLKHDLRRPTMEEIGYRSIIFTLDGMVGSQRDYIHWLLKTCTAEGTKVGDIITPEAIELLSEKLRTPLQIQQHLTLAMEAAYQTGEKPISLAILESVLSKQLDDLEPRLTRHGYNARDLVTQFNAKPAEINLLFRGKLEPARAQELAEQMLSAGLPI